MAMTKTSEPQLTDPEKHDDTGRPPAKQGNHSEKQMSQQVKEINGPKGPEPTRYGDWEVNGRCSDF